MVPVDPKVEVGAPVAPKVVPVPPNPDAPGVDPNADFCPNMVTVTVGLGGMRGKFLTFDSTTF